MLTLPQLRQRIVGRRAQSAKYVRIIHVKKGWDSTGRGYVACASYSTKIWDHYRKKFVKNETGPNKKPRRYVTVFTFLDRRLHVITSCSCPDFKYRWEVALNRKQAAEIEYSNGELPVIRNPAMRATFCKHCLALFTKIESELPKPKRNDKTPPIGAPEIGVPPSVLKKRAEEEEAARKAAEIKPIKISGPKNKNRTGKAGKKQSTMPRQKPAAEEQKPQQPTTPPAMMRAPKKSEPVSKGNPPAMMRAPKAEPKPKSKPVSRGMPPAMITPNRVIKNRGKS